MLRIFREWKRQGYEMVLDSLKKYSQTLQQVAASQKAMTPVSSYMENYRNSKELIASINSSSGGSKARMMRPAGFGTPTNLGQVSTGGTAVPVTKSMA